MATTEAAEQPNPGQSDDAVLAPIQNRGILVDAPVDKAPDDGKGQEADTTQATIDRMGNELGEARKAVKELTAQIEAMRQGQAAANAPEPVSYEDDPAGYIQQAIDSALEHKLGPKLQVLESDLLVRQSEKFDQKVKEAYPDWQETAKMPEFADWVKASPARIQMYQIADRNFDVESTVELIKRFRQDQAEAQANQAGAINAAGLVEGGGNTDSGGRVYAASEIKRMINDDPEGYQRWLSTDGMRAYSEGRVDQNR